MTRSQLPSHRLQLDPLTRRGFFAGALATAATASVPALGAPQPQPKPSASQSKLVDPKTLKSGQFAWQPELSPSGPVVVIVSIPDQWAAVYRNGIRIGISTCSTGKPGHETPTGTFLILQKDVDHHSSLYDDAPMPFMNRLTWGGVALHAGKLPGYPASHGCVRLPPAFAKLLYGVTHIGTVVILADHKYAPADIFHPGLLLPQHADAFAKDAIAKEEQKKAAEKEAKAAGEKVVSVVISTSEKRMIVLINGEPSFEDKIGILEPSVPFGLHVFNLSGISADQKKVKWMVIGTDSDKPSPLASALIASATIERIDLSDATRKRLAELLHPGATIIITDQSVEEQMRTKPGFTILAEDDTMKAPANSAPAKRTPVQPAPAKPAR